MFMLKLLGIGGKARLLELLAALSMPPDMFPLDPNPKAERGREGDVGSFPELRSNDMADVGVGRRASFRSAGNSRWFGG
jgi:hypothetical protein